MGWLVGAIDDWLRELLLEANMNSFTNMLQNVNASVQDVAYQVGQTPQGWNSGIFAMVRNLSETVILPIAGIILTFVLCYELIQLIIEKNNMHDFDTFNIFKWIGKSFVAVLILTNTWNIVMGVFDLAQGVVSQSAGLITGDLTLGSPDMLLAIATQLEALGTGELLVLFLQVQVVGLLMEIMAVVITIIVWGRMIEIYVVASIAPIPLATMVNREWGQMGNNYPDNTQHGDVMDADFTQFHGYDLVMGGSPCTFWSIAKANREVDKSGMGWALFMRFVDAIREVQPRYFLYENVASMPAAIKQFISEELGCEPVMISSALVSAQQRKRLYWTNIPVTMQPIDQGVLLKDVLEPAMLPLREKSQTLCANMYKVNADNSIKRKDYGLLVCAPVRVGVIGNGGQGSRIYSVQGKTVAITAKGGSHGGATGLYKIDLPDGDYTIRKLTPIEAERCQTLPDDYTALGVDDAGRLVKISNTQRYKGIGNGWTVDVIAHILNGMEVTESAVCTSSA